ncbi:MAG TPA: hypothetical protein VFB96_22300 [Pirellulaceae bacterium]|jgi:hypothetical protein|nr:hypothetical protein [Pirellulaceae bacterium]
MHGEVDTRQTETALLDSVDLPAVPEVAEVIASIATDAALAASQYLSETVVPHGGE